MLFCRTMHGVMQNIAHLCTRSRSKTWGAEGWKKVSLVSSRLVLAVPLADDVGRRLRGRRRSVEDESPDEVGFGRSGMLSGWRGEERDQRKACGMLSILLTLLPRPATSSELTTHFVRLLISTSTPHSVSMLVVKGAAAADHLQSTSTGAARSRQAKPGRCRSR